MIEFFQTFYIHTKNQRNYAANITPNKMIEDSYKSIHREDLITVLFLETSLGMGGSEKVWLKLIRLIDRNRFRPIVCCLYRRGALGAHLFQEGVCVYQSLAGNRWDLRVFYRLNRLLRRERVDIIYVINQAYTQFWASVCRKFGDVPVLISSIHNTGKIKRVRRKSFVNRLTMFSVDCVTALSPNHRDYLVENEHISPQKIAIVTNGIEVERYHYNDVSKTRMILGLNAATPVVGIVAMLRPEKSHDVLLKAFLIVSLMFPTSVLLIIGDGPERKRLEELTARLKIQKKVRFLGVRDDIPQLLAALDVAVLCSQPVVETLPVSVLEYMASSKPVVATNVGSLPDLVEDGINGYLVNPGDIDALADRIVKLLSDPTLARKMGIEGRKKVFNFFSVKKMVQQYECLFIALLRAHRKRRHPRSFAK